jgi:hypothetical protein
MSDPRFPTECYACGEPIEAEEEIVVTAGWDYEFTVPCHRECVQEEARPRSI